MGSKLSSETSEVKGTSRVDGLIWGTFVLGSSSGSIRNRASSVMESDSIGSTKSESSWWSSSTWKKFEVNESIEGGISVSIAVTQALVAMSEIKLSSSVKGYAWPYVLRISPCKILSKIRILHFSIQALNCWKGMDHNGWGAANLCIFVARDASAQTDWPMFWTPSTSCNSYVGQTLIRLWLSKDAALKREDGIAVLHCLANEADD